MCVCVWSRTKIKHTTFSCSCKFSMRLSFSDFGLQMSSEASWAAGSSDRWSANTGRDLKSGSVLRRFQIWLRLRPYDLRVKDVKRDCCRCCFSLSLWWDPTRLVTSRSSSNHIPGQSEHYTISNHQTISQLVRDSHYLDYTAYSIFNPPSQSQCKVLPSLTSLVFCYWTLRR